MMGIMAHSLLCGFHAHEKVLHVCNTLLMQYSEPFAHKNTNTIALYIILSSYEKTTKEILS